jgi:hypothetical protein
VHTRIHLLLSSALLTLSACADKGDDTRDYGDCDPDLVDSRHTGLDEDGSGLGCLDDLESQEECDQLWSDLSEAELESTYGALVADGFELEALVCGPMWLDGACCALVYLDENIVEEEEDDVEDGRPFLVQGVRRRAPVTGGQGWAVASDVAAAPVAHRAALVAHWMRVGQMEHASVAAFARFSMALMHHGAPAELVRDAHLAALDEVRHARVCFGLAEAVGGAPVAPAGLDMTAALDGELDLERMTRTLVAEGCVGETLAALQVSEAARQARDPALRAVLEGIAADETRHAALAWRTLAWLVEQHPHLADVARAALAEAGGASRVPARAPGGDDLSAHGCLDEATRARVRAVGLRDVVTALAAETLGRAVVGADPVGVGSAVGYEARA